MSDPVSYSNLVTVKTPGKHPLAIRNIIFWGEACLEGSMTLMFGETGFHIIYFLDPLLIINTLPVLTRLQS